GCQRIDLASCASTNDEAARLARAGARHGTVVIAESQTGGRGRDGRTWHSPPGGLYLSAIVRPPLPIADVPPMTLAIGIGACDAAREFGARAERKWPNALLVAESAGTGVTRIRKPAGVPVGAQSEGSRLDAVIVGIGVNLTGELPGPVAESAITLAEAAGTTVDREPFITQLLANLERWIDRYVGVGIEAIIPAWQQRMATGL